MKATEQQKESMKRYYEKTKDKRRKQMIDYRNNNKEKYSEYKKEYYQNNKDYIKKKSKKYREEHLEEVKKKLNEYYYKNREELKAKYREYTKNVWYPKNKKSYQKKKLAYENNRKKIDLNFRIRKLLRYRVWTAFKNYSKNGKTKSADEYGINYEAIITKLISELPSDFNVQTYELDHRKPLCTFDFSYPEQIKIAFSPENHQWLEKEKHLKKTIKDCKQSLKKINKMEK